MLALFWWLLCWKAPLPFFVKIRECIHESKLFILPVLIAPMAAESLLGIILGLIVALGHLFH